MIKKAIELEKSSNIFSLSEIVHELPDGADVAIGFGHFDVVHPGHIRYLENARSFGDVLIVGIQTFADDDGFPIGEISVMLSYLSCVDYVVILDPRESFLDFVSIVKPHTVVLGDRTLADDKNMASGIKFIHQNNISLKFASGEPRYFTSRRENTSVSQDFHNLASNLRKVAKNLNIPLGKLTNLTSNPKRPKIVVLGDTILDRYIYCDALGMSAEAPVIVAKEIEEKEFLGGAAIVAAHCAALGAEVEYISVLGAGKRDESGNALIANSLESCSVSHHFFYEAERVSTIKKRYLVGEQKLLRVSRLSQFPISQAIESDILERLREVSTGSDVMIVADFVYGVVTDNILRELLKIRKESGVKLHGDLQCSSQTGDASRFQGFDLVTPTEREARVALNDASSGLEKLAKNFMAKSNVNSLCLTLGADGLVGYVRDNTSDTSRYHIPALNSGAVDVAGAGDSFLAAASFAVANGADQKLAFLFGSVAASIAVSRMGNVPITRQELQSIINLSEEQ